MTWQTIIFFYLACSISHSLKQPERSFSTLNVQSCAQLPKCESAQSYINDANKVNPAHEYHCSKGMGWNRKKNIAKNESRSKEADNMKAHLVRLGKFREKIIDAFWTCSFSKQHEKVCHESESSDYDCTIIGPQSQSIIASLGLHLRCMLENDLKCKKPSNPANLHWINHYFRSNFYGALEAVPLIVFPSFVEHWVPDKKSQETIFQRGFRDRNGFNILRTVCEETTMTNIINGKVKQLSEQIKHRETKLYTPVDLEEKTILAQQNFYKKLKKEAYWVAKNSTPKFDWPAFHEDLSAIGALQAEPYLTYAGIFDIEIRNQWGIVPSPPISDEQDHCVSVVSTQEQVVFILQALLEYIPPEPANVDEFSLLKFLTQSSKYWARMYHSAVVRDCHWMIDWGDRINTKKYFLNAQDPLYKQFKTYFGRCLSQDKAYNPVGKTRSEIFDGMEAAFKRTLGRSSKHA